MVRSAWVKPMTLVQKFEANEAVAAEGCYQVVCESKRYGDYWLYQTKGPTGHPAEIDGSDPWGRSDDLAGTSGTRKHDGNVCRQPNFNLVYGDNGKFQGINDWWVTYQSDDDGDGITEVGDRVYWCNDEFYSLAESFRFNHWGTVTAVDPTHPNRS